MLWQCTSRTHSYLSCISCSRWIFPLATTVVVEDITTCMDTTNITRHQAVATVLLMMVRCLPQCLAKCLACSPLTWTCHWTSAWMICPQRMHCMAFLLLLLLTPRPPHSLTHSTIHLSPSSTIISSCTTVTVRDTNCTGYTTEGCLTWRYSLALPF